MPPESCPYCKGRDIRLMRHHDDGDALFAIQRAERLHNLVRISGIEIAGRFIRQQQARLVDQGAGDRDPLLLPARQLARRVAFTVA